MSRISLGIPAISRIVAVLALSASTLASVAVGSVSPASAVSPLEFAAATVTPADSASFMAFSLDLESEQYLRAQELLGRILGAEPEDVADDLGFETMMPEELGDLPRLQNGQGAIVAKQQDLTSLMMGGMFDPSMLEEIAEGDDLSDASVAVESIAPDQLQGIAFVLTADNIDEVGDALVAEFLEEAEDQGDVVLTIEGENGSIVSTVEIRDAYRADELGFRAIAQVEGAVIIGFSEADLLPFVAVAAGSAPALADDPGYQAAMALLPADVLFGGYAAGMNSEQIDSLQSAMEMAGLPLAMDLIVQPTGPTAFAVQASDEGFRIETATLAAPDSAASPVPAVPGTLTLDRQVPADTMIFANGLDLGASPAMRAAEQMILLLLQGRMGGFDETPTAYTAQTIADQFAGLEMLLGFNAQTDLIEQLTGEYGFYVSSFDFMDPGNFGVLFVSGVDDAATVTDATNQLVGLSSMLGGDMPPIDSVTVGDAEINQIMFDLDGIDVPVQFGVVGDQLLIGAGSALVNFALGGSQTLDTNPVYTEAMGYLPAPETGIYFVNTPEIASLAMMGASLFVMTSEEIGGGSFDAYPQTVDAAERCAEFDDQAEAQAAYDSDPIANFDLDFDFDGAACDDYFEIDVVDDSDDDVMISEDPLGALMGVQINVGGLAMVSYDENGVQRMSGILVVPESD